MYIQNVERNVDGKTTQLNISDMEVGGIVLRLSGDRE